MSGPYFGVLVYELNVLHSFGGGANGTLPFAGLLDVGGTLYGTTSAAAEAPVSVRLRIAAGAEPFVRGNVNGP